uniref:Uncharacterized protein n=1 Tax=Chromera velia CCMP2878 TaxID=1169474 RepID=A0A0G4IAC5_9ALVE|eukprot:Cvel_2101.t1-p1 / transcript=Cvel_2101.t1 / gene=Cvel_2101 / organism=Chromera_velia_CCMP2878 / gene_product=Ankyrin-3, putative / transcript_product=Ankyrin-3, putative / location=Cvel_scaffold81:39590-40882(+) / protein_length=431 / sequence_SO=supercontig / SO=protein_coding / is_pseudo=false
MSTELAAAVTRELETLNGELLSVVAQVTNMIGVLKNSDTHLTGTDSPVSDTASQLPPLTAEALSRLRTSVQDSKRTFEKELKGIADMCYQWDMNFCFVGDTQPPADNAIFQKVRSFEAVSPEELHNTLLGFVESPEENRKREDLALLLHVGAQVDGLADSGTALMTAVEYGSLEGAEMLVEAGADLWARDPDGHMALHRACEFDEPEIAKFLVEKGAYVDAENKRDERPLHIAAEHGQIDVMDLLISEGANVHARDLQYGDTPLHIAVSCNRIEAVQFLLDRGACVDITNRSLSTPLYRTLISGAAFKEVAQLLISRGADPNGSGDLGCRFINEAAFRGAAGVFEVLLESGADMQRRDVNGLTILHYVARPLSSDEPQDIEEKKLHIGKLLVATGIDTNALTDDSNTAQDLAEQLRPEHSILRKWFSELTA